jgi:hypothetical protein
LDNESKDVEPSREYSYEVRSIDTDWAEADFMSVFAFAIAENKIPSKNNTVTVLWGKDRYSGGSDVDKALNKEGMFWVESIRSDLDIKKTDLGNLTSRMQVVYKVYSNRVSKWIRKQPGDEKWILYPDNEQSDKADFAAYFVEANHKVSGNFE